MGVETEALRVHAHGQAEELGIVDYGYAILFIELSPYLQLSYVKLEEAEGANCRKAVCLGL